MRPMRCDECHHVSSSGHEPMWCNKSSGDSHGLSAWDTNRDGMCGNLGSKRILWTLRCKAFRA